MKYLLDSDFVIDFLRAMPHAIRLLHSLIDDELAISLVTYGEVYEGIYTGPDVERQERDFRNFRRGVKVVPLSQPIMRRFAQIRGELRRGGLLIPDPDLMIAATALHHGQTLVTRNTRHFARVPGLSLHPLAGDT